MESFWMAAQVVVPMAIMVGIGVLLRVFHVTDETTMKQVDNLIFKIFMPSLSFYNIYKTDFSQLTNIGYILYGAVGLMILFGIALLLVPKWVQPRATASSFGQALFRSNYLLFGAAVAESIYGAVGCGVIADAYVITRLYEEQQKAEEAAAPKAPPALPEVGESAAARTGKPTQGIYVEGGSGMLVRFARCCNPVPGDDIVGYITRGRGVTVHKADCVNAQHSEPERAIRVSWAEESIGRFTTTIQVIAYDHPSLLGELTVFVQDGGAPISAMSVKISKNKTCTIQMEVQVESREKLDAVLARIRKRPDVIEAFRLGR